MANGANRLFDVIKQTGESTNGISSQVVSLTIKSVNPLILMRDDRLEIPAEFCILHKSLNIDTFRINDIVTAIVLNNGQQYFILYNNTAEEQGANYNDLSNKPKINGVELNGNKTSDDLLIVSKSGDTLTGELQFNNKNDYAVFRKTRTINGTDYNANFGLGANQSARIEFQDANENILGNLEVRSGGIYNGLSNRKLPEVAYVAWSSSLSFKMTGGHALVMINQNDCLILWVAGAGPDCNVVRLLGNGIQVSYDTNTKTVTLKYQDNHNFTGTAFIATG